MWKWATSSEEGGRGTARSASRRRLPVAVEAGVEIMGLRVARPRDSPGDRASLIRAMVNNA